MGLPPFRDVTVGDLLTHLARAPSRAGPRCSTSAVPATPSPSSRRKRASIARGLIARGVEPGERVVVWATNVPEWIVLQFALAKIGAILVTANTSLRAQDIEYLLRQSEAATLVTISGFRGVDYIAELERDRRHASAPFRGLERLIFIGRGDELCRRASSRTTRLRSDAHARLRREPRCARRRGRRRRRDQHAVHVGHDRLSQGRDALEPQHRQQRLRAGRACSATRRTIGCACACRCFTASAA